MLKRRKMNDGDGRQAITLRELTLREAFDASNGSIEGGSPQQELRNLLITDPYTVRDRMLREYDVWYGGNADELLNFYTEGMTFSFATEPWYGRNIRNCFWARSSTEGDISRVHSNIARSAIDTLSSLIGRPTVSVSHPEDALDYTTVRNPKKDVMPESYKIIADRTKRLTEILDANNFWDIYDRQKQRTLALGWGCYKVDALPGTFDEPLITFYDANDVDFVKRGNRVTTVIFRDWIIDSEGMRVCVVETRTLTKNGTLIKTRCYRQTPLGNGGDAELVPLTEEEISSIPSLKGTQTTILFEGCKELFAYPCMYIEEDSEMGKASNMPGRSILAGRICILDDIDQSLSQKNNAVRKSTPVEYFNTDFLERDAKTGLPIMPHNFDRKYTSFHGGRNAEGSPMSAEPVQITQPAINFTEYDQAAIESIKFFLHGWVSPATLGIDVAKQSTQESQREKEKITTFTKQRFASRDERNLKSLFKGVLMLDEWMHSKPHKITKVDYDISVKYPDFADNSFEERLQILGDALDNGNISPREYMHRLYLDSLKGDEYEDELAYLMTVHNPNGGGQQGMDGMMDPMAMMQQGMSPEEANQLAEGPAYDAGEGGDQQMADLTGQEG